MEAIHDEIPAGRSHLSPRGLIILALILLQGMFAIWHLAGLQTIPFMDTAYYYVVAKNIAHGKANPDTVVWHYIGTPAAVERPAGDYWGAGWPYALGFLMRWTGDSPIAALRICAFLSVFLPVAVFLLLGRLTSRWCLAAFGAVLVCLQTRLFQVMVTPDVTLSYQLITTAGFALFLGVLKDRPSVLRLLPSAFVLTLPIWLRGEGFIPLVAATIGLLAAPWPWKLRLRSIVAFAVLAGICLLPYVVYNVHYFGHITPESRALTPLMTEYKQIYELGNQPSLASYRALGFKGIVGLRIDSLKLFADFFIWQNVPYLLMLAGVFGPALRWIITRRPVPGESARSDQQAATEGCRTAGIVALWSFVVLSAAVPLLIAPIVNTPSRFLTNTTPVLCVLAVWAVEPLLRYQRTVNIGLLIAAAFLLAYVQFPFHVLRPWSTAWKAPCLEIPTCLSPGNHPALNADDTVLTEMPCQLSAQLGVDSINVPQDGTTFDDSDGSRKYWRFFHTAGREGKVVSAESCRQAIERYHPRFLLVEDGSNLDQIVKLLKDLSLRVVSRGTNQDGRGYTWFALTGGAQGEPK